LLFTVIGWSQVNITTTGSYTQNFNTGLVSSGSGTFLNNSTIPNWFAKRSGTATSIAANTGTTTTGNLYSFGTAAADRALGSIGSNNSAAGDFAYGLLLRNTSGITITTFSVAYTGEQWRVENNDAQSVTFWYKIGSTIASVNDLQPNNNSSWTEVTALKFTSPKINLSGAALDGNLAANRTVISTVTFPSFGLANNEYIMIKWDDPNHQPGSDHALAIDDVTVSWSTVPPCTGVSVTSVTPTSGPVGTEVTINAASGLLGASATFGGIAANIVSITDTKLVVTIPATAVTGNLIVSNAAACAGTPIPYTVIKEDNSGCQTSTTPTDLFISEVADSNGGSMTYIEVYNYTGVTKSLSNYRMKFASNGGGYGANTYSLGSASIPDGAAYVFSISVDAICSTPGGDGSYADYNITSPQTPSGVNFGTNGDDHIGLFNAAGTTLIDSWGIFGNSNWVSGSPIGSLGGNGADFRRKNSVTVPNPVYSNSDWDIVDFTGSSCVNDYSDLDSFKILKNAPAVVSNTPAAVICTTKTIDLSVTATEGHLGGAALAYQWYYNTPGNTAWTAVPTSALYSGETSATLHINTIDLVFDYQYYCRILESGATCYTASNAYVIKDIPSATWNGTWTPSAPTNTMKAVIGANYNTTTSGSIDACKCQINSGVTVTVTDAHYLDVVMGINNGGTIIRASGGSIGQSNDTGANTGTGINTLNRTTSSYDRFDSTYFSAPVSNTTIGLPFAGWRINDSYSFNPANWSDLNNDNFDDNGDAWVRLTAATPMIPGVGYAVMAPTTGTFPTTANVQFTGTLNNGEIKVPLLLSGNAADANDDYNFVGNPYPSKLDVVKFIDANILPANNRISGTVYLWTHKRPVAATVGPYQYNFSVADYAMRTKFAGTSSGMGSPAPTQYLATEQGFFVEAVNPGDLIFNNSMRVHETTDNFYKSQAGPESMSRIWLNMESSLGFMSQLAVGYADNSSLDVDPGYDGLMFPAGNVLAFYSTIGTDAYKIQARGNYDADDVIPLGYTYDATISGTFDIRMDEADGFFDAGNAAPVFLEDLDLHIIHDLRQGAYSFSTAPGIFNNRFVLRFTNTALGNTNFDALQKQVVVAQKGQKVSIRSAVQPLQEIVVYDLLGRTIYTSEKLNQNEFSTSDIAKAQQGLIVKIRLQDGSTVTKKIFL